ncbi:apelin receptor A-like [Ambystoma mexicanum]|uniref:apelin receptor A-like n=1 Tax=Ambystoma mexicanum TaxID=8296 RepID=UPI0037E97F04
MGAMEEYYPGMGDYYEGYGNETGFAQSCDESDWELSFSLLPVLYMLVFVLGLSGNGVVMFTVWRARPRRRSADTYIGHLALADLAFVVTLPLWAAYTALRFNWPFGSALCKLSSYLVLLNMFASVFCLSCLSLERYLAIVRPRPAGRPRTRAALRLSLAAIWALAGVLALPALLLRDTQARGNTTVCDMDFSSVASREYEHLWIGGLSLVTTALGFVLPLLLMTAFYCFIGGRVNAHFQGLKEGPKRRRLLRIIVALVVVFALCWLPFHLLKSLYFLNMLEVLNLSCDLLGLISRLHPYATCLAYINSCLNPFLYAFFDPRFRAQCLQLLGIKKALQGQLSNISSTMSAQTQKSELHSLATKV